MKWSSIGEGIGLSVVGIVVKNLNRHELLLPAMALMVGLHFFPIAHRAPFWPFYLLGIALLIASALGFGLQAPLGGAVAGGAAAVALWTAAVLAVRRDHLVQRTSAVDA